MNRAKTPKAKTVFKDVKPLPLVKGGWIKSTAPAIPPAKVEDPVVAIPDLPLPTLLDIPPSPLSEVAKKLEELGFCPVTELVAMYRANKVHVLTKDGSLVAVDMDPATRVRIATELMSYAHRKTKPTESSISDSVINVTINRF